VQLKSRAHATFLTYTIVTCYHMLQCGRKRGSFIMHIVTHTHTHFLTHNNKQFSFEESSKRWVDFLRPSFSLDIHYLNEVVTNGRQKPSQSTVWAANLQGDRNQQWSAFSTEFSCIMRLNPHKIQLNVIKIDLKLLFRVLILIFYSVNLLVGGYSRFLAFYI
jgi:hypothetical protein